MAGLEQLLLHRIVGHCASYVNGMINGVKAPFAKRAILAS
jgi:hypothetical protein